MRKQLWILIPLFLACSSKLMPVQESSINQQPAIFDKQGHRGCRGLMPENTVPAMYTALDLGVTTLELDVVISSDRQVVVSHEPWMGHEISRKPDGSDVTEREEKSLNLYRMTYDEIRRYDVGSKPHPRFPRQQKMAVYKPLLSDLLDSVAAYMRTSRRPLPYFNIETKCLPIGDGLFHPPPAEFAELLMAVIREKEVEERVIIQSFDVRTLQYLHKKYPHIKTALLIEDSDKRPIARQLDELGFIPNIYSPHYSHVTEELLRYCRDRNMKLIPWTVNTKEEITRLRQLGVDGIITDYPDLF
ncbi:MAG TPA: glycerophosphodiester phosphodiesterase [Lacibacter sp.]|nr:glycerophosphodiester phosphodiesterase [Lacibacter sp.]HMO87551.1 glycerophosphodiester phosphodiesterase [Lacibacter sp.]